MQNPKRVVAIIPARRDSRRCPGKNVRLLGNKPLIAWTIEAALRARFVDAVIVSSNDEKVLALQRTYSSVHFLQRPESLSTDMATSADVVNHVLSHLPTPFDAFALLQPTSPFRTHTHIDAAITLMRAQKVEQCVSVYPIEKPANYFYQQEANGSISPMHKKNQENQMLLPVVALNGAIYLSDVGFFKAQQTFVSANCSGFLMNEMESLDIDTENDFDKARRCLLNNVE